MRRRCSWGFLRSGIYSAKVEQVGVGIVAVDFEDFGNESSPRPAFDLDDDVQRIADIALDRAVRELDAALQNTTRKASEALLRGTRMDGGKRTGVARIQKLEEIDPSPAPDFAELRGGFACGWCEIRGDRLFLLAHPNSGVPTRQFAYPQEAEIVGRVTGIAMKIDKRDDPRK